MIRMIDHNGLEFWVAEHRVEEYLAAGNKLAAEPPAKMPKRKAPEKKDKK